MIVKPWEFKYTIPVLTELDFDAQYILDVFIIPVFDKYVFGFFEFSVWTQSKIKHKSPAYLVTLSAVIHVRWRISMCLPHHTSWCTLEFKIPFQPGRRQDCGQLLTCFQSCSPPWRNIIQFQGFFYILKREFVHALWWVNRILEVYRTQTTQVSKSMH